MLENVLSAPYLLKVWMYLHKLAQIYFWDVDKNLADFGDLDLISRSDEVIEYENRLFCTIFHEEVACFPPYLHRYVVGT